MTSAENYSENERKAVVAGEVKEQSVHRHNGARSAVSPQNRQGFSCNSVGLNRGGYKQNTELTTGGDTAEGNINEVATKGGTGYRGAAMFPSGRKNRGQKGKRKEPCFSEKRTAAFHEWLVFTKGYGAAKRER